MRKNNFKGYKLDFTARALKDLEKLDKNISEVIVSKLKDLVKGKDNVCLEKLKTPDDITYRLRKGDYRAICEVHNHQILVNVITVGHRKEIYRRY